MSHLEIELKNLKSEMLEMFALVKLQLEKSKAALVNLDKDLAREVLVNEKRVNGFELKLDRDCENIIALFNPVAIDLRLVLACMKINSNLERIGDIAEGISQFVLNIKLEPEKKLLETTRLIEMYDTAILITYEVMEAFNNEDTKRARSVFKMDEILDEINLNANQAVADFIRENPDRINQSLYLLSAIRKLERVGDQCKNISEEIIFYIEAKVLKHKSREQKQA
ncbi:MAG: phosphate signaling complex protein PhoU [Bacteroidia bacterium]|jgi:phosphate transport system protein|nr:phosphate signaling complex protein PhoU [Bacteroidia bacterium]